MSLVLLQRNQRLENWRNCPNVSELIGTVKHTGAWSSSEALQG